NAHAQSKSDRQRGRGASAGAAVEPGRISLQRMGFGAMRSARMKRASTSGALYALAAHGGWVAAMIASVLGCASRQPVPPQGERGKPHPGATPVIERHPVTPPDAGLAAAPSAERMSAEEGAIAEGELCLSCHSAELIQATRIGSAGWTAEMTKMRNWGAV